MTDNLETNSVFIIIIYCFLVGIYLLLKILKNKSNYTFSESFTTIVILALVFIFGIPIILIFLSYI